MSAEDEEDDYLNMTFGEPEQPKKETSIQRIARQKREAALRARVKPRAELETEAAAAREAALAKSLDESNKGFKMLAKMGFKGGALGKDRPDARVEPIAVEMKEGRSGIGLDSEKKRKFREEMEKQQVETKRTKVDEGDFRERTRLEQQQKRLDSQVLNAMKVAERLDEAEKGTLEQDLTRPVDGPTKAEAEAKLASKKIPLSSINVLWRSIVRDRLEKERSRRMRHDLYQSLSRLPTYDDPDEDEQDKQAMGNDVEDIEEEDLELDKFNALAPAERLEKLVVHLREMHHYCFWCKFQYPDATMDGCPGMTEEDHD
jgi:hypothetical protein